MNIDAKKLKKNISKLNPTTHKKYTPQLSGILPKFTKMVQHMQVNQCSIPHKQSQNSHDHLVVYHTDKVKSHMIISINTEKAFDKI